jgi:penicillin-binding protein 1C
MSRRANAVGERQTRRWRIAATALGLGAVATAVVTGAWIFSLGPPPLGDTLDYSTVVLDRSDRLLRAYVTEDGRWRLPITTEDVDPRFHNILLAYEDKRFWSHRGVDPLALVRAATQFIESRRIISGGSTLTMQVARLLEPRHERSLGVKLREIVRAVELELTLSKPQILNLYLNLAPYGGNLEGIRAASLAYFGKEPKRLSLAETALLVALPQSPELRRPDRSVDAARRARDRVLERIETAGLVPRIEVDQARREPVPAGRKPLPMLSPHAADQAVAAAPTRRIHRLTIDAKLQRSLEELARDHAQSLGREISVAIVAIDNASNEVLARVGSADFMDERRGGYLDMTAAVRSPGSALKPFIYGLAFEDGILHPESLLDDHPVRYGAYAPENFDLTFQGTVTARRALQLSLNVPAVEVLDAVGAGRLAARLSEAGMPLILPKWEAPGLAIGLGGVGIRLVDLTRLYAGLARLGTTLPLVERRDGAPAAAAARLLEPAAAWSVGNILIGTPPPENALGGRIAFKTGTSYGNRDAWSIGFDGRRTIGVWVGRPDGAPVAGLVGRVSAAPILFDAFARLRQPIAPLMAAPKSVLMTSTAKLPLPLQRFRPGRLPNDAPTPPLHILFPPNGAQLELSGPEQGRMDPVALKISGGVSPLTVLVNGVPVDSPNARRSLFFSPDGPGFIRLTVMDARGASDSVVVRLQ